MKSSGRASKGGGKQHWSIPDRIKPTPFANIVFNQIHVLADKKENIKRFLSDFITKPPQMNES